MVDLSMDAASGMLAACTRPLTADALASTAADPSKDRREIMTEFPSSVLVTTSSPGRRRSRGGGLPASCCTSANNRGR